MNDELAVAILAELQTIRALLESRPEDHAGALLSSIRSTWGAESFTTSELLLFAHRPGAAALRSALRSAGCSDSARRLGKLLAALAGDDCGGLSVERIGADRTGALWKVCEFPAGFPVVTRIGDGHAQG